MPPVLPDDEVVILVIMDMVTPYTGIQKKPAIVVILVIMDMVTPGNGGLSVGVML